MSRGRLQRTGIGTGGLGRCGTLGEFRRDGFALSHCVFKIEGNRALCGRAGQRGGRHFFVGLPQTDRIGLAAVAPP